MRGWMLVLVLTIVIAGAATRGPEAIFVRPEVEEVPVERLIANLTKKVAQSPNDATAHAQLARVHAMAAATGATSANVTRGTNEVFFGLGSRPVPFEAKPTTDPGARQRAEEHYKEALNHYRQALTVNPEDLTTRLGYAWTLDQSGAKTAAIAEYRTVIADAWLKDQTLRMLGPAQYPLTVEAGGYLVKLLDPVKDATEIAAIEERRARIARLPRAITPIAVPLGDVGPETFIDSEASIAFDADGSSLPRRWTWITPDAAWLVYDPTEGGRITSALQMFGSVTFWVFWKDGYDALASLDDDGNGELRGGELAGLALWHDRDRDGVSDPGEVLPVSKYRIAALACLAERTEDDPSVAAVARRGVTFEDGRTRATYDVLLRTPATSATSR
jgi:tetratricopeptide (TPR) repeat protein